MDQLSAMRVFVRVVQTGSFSAVGREMNSSQATISKKVAALETRLGVKLLTRSSRDHSLTEAGVEYFEKCLILLAELDEVEARVRSQVASPRGVLKITAPVAFGRLVLASLIKDFLLQFPDIRIDLSLSDRHVDLIAEGVDIAIRARKLEDSTLIAQPLFDNPMLPIASPEYLESHGTPQHPDDLKEHNCILYSLAREAYIWRFHQADKTFSVPVSGNFQSDNGDTNLEVVLSGLGITQLPIWMVEEYLQTGKLIRLLSDYGTDSIPFNAIYPQNRYVPLKVRCFIDFLKQKLTERGLV
ncbi:LysR family transcriptional regulator [Amphritea sp. HPY]|uniref:LysR family transcriptional regulator n=1 Tax=Amphritea sp. HPY TaxID=3421652 RepID=UPI003D7C479C